MRNGGESKISFCYPRDLRVSTQTIELYRPWTYNISSYYSSVLRPTANEVAYQVCVECLWIIKSMEVGFCFIWG